MLSAPRQLNTVPDARQLTLPIELYRPVVQFIDVNDTLTLWALLLTSRGFTIEAERVLYRCLRVDTSAKQDQLLQRLIDCKRVALFVRHITLPYRRDPDNPADICRACEALSALCNLKSLTIKRCLTAELSSAICRCTFQLERFECHGIPCSPDAFRGILSNQPSLKYFRCDDLSFPLASTLMPNLSVLYVANNYVLYTLVRGRCIDYLINYAHGGATADQLAPLANLRGCTLGCNEGSSPRIVPPTARQIPNVEHLTLVGYDVRSFVHLLSQTDDSQLKVAASLHMPPGPGLRKPRTPRLRTLFVELDDVTVPGPDIKQILTPLFKKIHTLECIEVMYSLSDADDRRTNASIRWERDAEPRRVERRAWRELYAEDSF